MSLPDLKDMTLEEIEAFVASLGKERFRARQIMKWIYQQGASSFAEMTNLSKEFRADMEKRARISNLEMVREETAADGTKKLLFRLEDGLFIESVLIPGASHWTLCLSTQAGCKMGCAFCFTAKSGFTRNLRPSEIVDQIVQARFRTGEGPGINNLVLMGMGEPLDNYDNVLKAIAIINSDYGLALSARKITLSTCGLAPAIERLGQDSAVNLAVSLNAPDDRRRNELMPINRKYPIEAIIKACKSYPMPRRRRITFEYILIAGVNDSPADAKLLVRTFGNLRCKFNLILFNEFPGSPFKAPTAKAVEAFQKVLVDHHFTAVVRQSRGKDILAACGQLSGRHREETEVTGDQ
ncbi:MAG TPA: 23S rRNA (adenine(2503)-C(2))-methyltransferase RlmN [Syntrophales bacterium]|nr:23S rRNA (adenine(2503)-C(2))-methyltransferase RlmN [Syntrophales bacterium]